MARMHELDVKFSAEKFLVGVDFSNLLDDGETIVAGTSTVTAEDADGTDVTDTLIVTDSAAVNGSILQAQIHQGTAGTEYFVTFHAVTSDGNVYEEVVVATVKSATTFM